MADGPHIEFGRKITVCRQRREWSLSEAARQMDVPRTSLSRWEHGHEMPRGENMIKLRDHLLMPIGTDEDTQKPRGLMEVAYQLALPFDQPANFELKVTRKAQDVVQIEFRLKNLAS